MEKLAEDVTRTTTSNGRQFGPSVIATFSNMYLAMGDAGFIDTLVAAKNCALQ
jgi:hypothetical protein